MYTISLTQEEFIVSDVAERSAYWMICDKPYSQKSQDILKRYLVEAQAIFMDKLSGALDTANHFTDKEAEGLVAMLRLLIDARKTWQEEDQPR